MIARVAFLLALASPVAAHAQTRMELLRAGDRASRNFVTEDSVQRLYRAALNPDLGRPDSAWAWGIHALTQSLLDAHDRDAARVWARWGMRLLRSMKIDSVNFRPGTVSVMSDAKLYTADRPPAEALTETTWRWPAMSATSQTGELIVMPRNISARMQVKVGRATVAAGVVHPLPVGSYDIEASAEGYISARITREVLPAVATVVSIALMPVGAAVAPAGAPVASAGAPDTMRGTERPSGFRLPFTKAVGSGRQCSSFQGPENAIDGQESVLSDRMWCQIGLPPHFLAVDLGSVCSINRVEIVHADPLYRIADFEVQFSVDGRRWRTLGKRVVGNQQPRTVHVTEGAPVRARVVRVYVIRARYVKAEEIRLVEVIAFGPTAC